MRRIVCARVQDTGEFDIIAATHNKSDEGETTAQGCPLATILPHLRGESFDAFFSTLVANGIIKFEHGHPGFVEMPGPCPFAQGQQGQDERKQVL